MKASTVQSGGVGIYRNTALIAASFAVSLAVWPTLAPAAQDNQAGPPLEADCPG